jgi:23S rRNA U2552 (ribose-2'-O)-methylase RlmE/FtsJ
LIHIGGAPGGWLQIVPRAYTCSAPDLQIYSCPYVLVGGSLPIRSAGGPG